MSLPETSSPSGAPRHATSHVGITIYGCDRDEDALFRELAPISGATVTLTSAAVCDETIDLARGNRCISVGHKSQVSRASLQLLSDIGVRFICTRSAGRNHIDVGFARRVGIEVAGVAYSPDSVADYTLMLMLMAVRNARSVLARVDAHDFRLHDVRGRELRDLTVGVVGTGRIGTAVIERLRGFGCHVLSCDRARRGAAEDVDLDELLRRSDMVTLHVPLGAETRHLLSRDRIGWMKPGAVVINTGRGALVDTAALVDALEAGALGGAALDVLEGEEGIFYADRRDEPLTDPIFLRLQRLPNVIITPHTAYFTDRALNDVVAHTLLTCRTYEESQQHA